jgi:hypothetical protein
MHINFQESLPHTPRRAQLRDAGWRTIAVGMSTSFPTPLSLPTTNIVGENKNRRGALAPVVEPFNTLEQAFSPYVADCAILEQLAPYFERISAPKNQVLWKQGDASDGLYVIGAGVLRATYHFAAHTPVIEESMVPGTLAGELSGLAGLARNATVVVEQQAVLWRLDADALRRLEAERPELARTFTALVLKGANLDVCCLVRESDVHDSSDLGVQLRNWISIFCSLRWRQGNERTTNDEKTNERNRNTRVSLWPTFLFFFNFSQSVDYSSLLFFLKRFVLGFVFHLYRNFRVSFRSSPGINVLFTSYGSGLCPP